MPCRFCSNLDIDAARWKAGPLNSSVEKDAKLQREHSVGHDGKIHEGNSLR